jgi:hypothetical protein
VVIKSDKNSSLRRIKKPRLKMLFKNSISGCFYDFGIVIPGPGGELIEAKEWDGICVDSCKISGDGTKRIEGALSYMIWPL